MASLNVIATIVHGQDAGGEKLLEPEIRDAWRSFTPSGHDLVILNGNLRL
jgi:hypothetical protein